MNPFYCETEKEIIHALRCGALAPELKRHAAACVICSDTLAVSEFLQANGTLAPVLPDPDFIWWRGQLASNQMAVERATRSIRMVRRISYLSISVATLWLVFAPGHLRSMVSALSKHGIWTRVGLSESVVLMAVGTLIFTFLSSLYLARSEK
jgi:hypothetical protein